MTRLQSPIVKNLHDKAIAEIMARTGAKNGDIIFFGADKAKVVNDAIGALSGIKNNVSHLDLSRTSVTDGVLSEVKKFNNLTWLNLKNTSITDRGIEKLASMPYLTYLNLVSSKVSDQCIKSIETLTKLEELYLWNSDVSEQGIARLRKALPETKILH